jgi:biopolymer transport protein ExbB
MRTRSTKTIWNLTFLCFAACFVAASIVAQDVTKTESVASTASGGTASGDAASGGDDHPESYLDFAMAGGWLMVPIGVCSLLWLTFLVERVLALRRVRILPAGFESSVRNLPSGSINDEEFANLCRSNDSSGARVLAAAATHLSLPHEEIERSVNNAAQREIHILRRYLRLFAVIAAVAPLLGLLGTVTGMIQAFREVASQGLGSGKALAPGIYKALVTTAGGLVVAIPALLTHHWLSSRIENYVHAIDNLVIDFVAKHRAQRARAEGSPPSARSVAADSVEAGSA